MKKIGVKELRKLAISTLCLIALVLGMSLITAETGWSFREKPKVLKIGIIPAEEPEKMIEAFQPLIKSLENTVGMKVEPFIATDYAGVIEAMRVGKIDLAWFGPFSYIMAAERAGAEAIAKGINKKGDATYRSVIIAHKESGFKTLNDLNGKTFAFVDEASTSGHIIPRFMLRKAGLDPDKDFKSFIFAGGHDAVGLAVKHRRVDAGGMSETTFKTMVEKGVIAEGDVIVLTMSEPIPNSPFAVRKGIAPELKKKIQQAILDVDKYVPKGQVMGWDKVVDYVEARDKDYDIIREVQKLLGL